MKVHIGMEQVKCLIVTEPSAEVLGCAPAIILMIYFSKMKIFPVFEELPPIIILHFIIECNYA